MGASCCRSSSSSSKTAECQLSMNEKKINLEAKRIPKDYQMALELIRSEYQINDFTVSVNGILINSQESYQKILKTSKAPHFKISEIHEAGETLKTFELETDFCKNICPEYHSNLCIVTGGFLELRSLIIGKGFVCISNSYFSRGIPKDLKCEFMAAKLIVRRLAYLNTFQGTCFFKVITKKSSDLKNVFKAEAPQEEKDLKIRVNNELVSVERNRSNPNILYSKAKIFDKMKTGDYLFGPGVLLGVLIWILDPYTAEIISFSVLIQTSNEIRSPPSSYNIPDEPENNNHINEYMGSIFDENDKFLMPWIVIHTCFVLVPIEIVNNSSKNLQLSIRGQKYKLSQKKVETKETTFSKYEFYVFIIEKPLDFVLPETLATKIKKRAELPNGNGEYFMLRKESKTELLIDEKISHLFFGYMIFSHSKLGGIVLNVLEHRVTFIDIFTLIEEMNKLKVLKPKRIESSKKPKLAENKLRLSIDNLRFNNPPVIPENLLITLEKPQNKTPGETPVEENFQFYKKEIVEAGVNEELVSNSFTISVDIPEYPPTAYSYAFFDNKIIKYSSELYNPVVSEKVLSMREGGSFTATPNGLVYIVGEYASVIKEEDQVLPSLKSQHFFHCSIWHQDHLFVISGENNEKVEKFNFSRNAWLECPGLPEYRQEASVCSTGSFLYLMGGENNGEISKDVFKFDGIWQKLEICIPAPLKNLGVIFDKDQFVLFAGKGKSLLNDQYFVLKEDFTYVLSGELAVTGEFSQKAIGYVDGVYSFILTENLALEYHDGFFRQVALALTK